MTRQIRVGLIPLPNDDFPTTKQYSVQKLALEFAATSQHDVRVYAATSKQVSNQSLKLFPGDVTKSAFNVLGPRICKYLFDTEKPGWRRFYKWAYSAAAADDVDVILQEEHPTFLRSTKNKAPVAIRIHARHTPRALAQAQRHAQLCILVSQRREHDAILKMPALNTCVIYNGTRIAAGRCRRESPTRASDCLRLLFLGRIIRSKGIFELKAAVQDLRHQGQPIELDIAGDGEPGVLQDIASATWIRYVGLLKPEDLPLQLDQCDALIAPSLGEEGLPLCLMEALAAGVPIIASNRGGVLEILEDGRNGIVIGEAVNATSIACAIKRFIGLRNQLATNVWNEQPAYAERFSSARMVSELDSALEALLK